MTIEDSIKDIIKGIGEDTDREGIKYTPTRVARLYKNIFYAYRKKLKLMREDERNTQVPEDVIPITGTPAESPRFQSWDECV